MKNRCLSRRLVVAALTIIISAIALPVFALPDIDVLYISRTPRYQKFMADEEKNVDPRDLGLTKPHIAKGTENLQRWPKKGELVTFTAVVKNMGDQPTGEFDYKWFFDGKEVKSGKIPSLEPGEQTTVTYQWTWDSEWIDHDVRFTADPNLLIKEKNELNNTREDRTNAFSFRLHVWQSVYDWFKTEAPKINPNISGFEDWAQMQMGYINQMFTEAVYPSTPQGILQRVRLDEVVIEPEDTPDPAPYSCHAPDNWEWDCRWGFGPVEYPRIFTDENEPHPEFITGPYSWVMHEWGHQMGKIDIYNWCLDKERNHVQPYGHFVTHINDLMTSTLMLSYSEMHASVFNYELHKRRGTFGEYQFDLPRTCKVRVLDAYGQPIPNAKIKFYQDHGHEVNFPEDFSGTTDANGVFTMPNRSVKGEEMLATGHEVHDNPWGLFHLAGFNALFFCDIQAYGQTDYQYIEAGAYNMAFRSGAKDSYTYDMRTTIVPGGRVTTNDLFAIKMVSDKKGYAVGAGGTILQWDGKKWSHMPSPTGQALFNLDVDPSGTLAVAVSGQGTIITCTNGKWTKKDLGDGANLLACAAPSANVILVGGERGELYRSTDGGENWDRIEAAKDAIRSIRFAGPKNGIMICDGPAAYYTTDGGETWTKSDSEFKFTVFQGWGSRPEQSATLTDCCMASETDAWACCEEGVVFRSTDGGRTWQVHTDFANFARWQPLYCIDMKPGATGWTSGSFDRFYDTVPIKRFYANGKVAVEPVTAFGASDRIYDISCVNANDGWLVGKGGLILRVQGIEYAPVVPHGLPR